MSGRCWGEMPEPVSLTTISAPPSAEARVVTETVPPRSPEVPGLPNGGGAGPQPLLQHEPLDRRLVRDELEDLVGDRVHRYLLKRERSVSGEVEQVPDDGAATLRLTLDQSQMAHHLLPRRLVGRAGLEVADDQLGEGEDPGQRVVDLVGGGGGEA